MKLAFERDGLAEALSRVDWNFPRAATPVNTVHSLHWFPGNFIPQIPAFLIQLLSQKGDLVCDPFCGSGTTGIEAVRLGRRCRQSDINRASIQVAKGKEAAFTGKDVVRDLSRVMDGILLELSAAQKQSCASEAILDDELRHWLHPSTYRQLLVLWGIVESLSGNARATLEVIFTDTLFACASVSGAKTRTGKIRRHHWGWVADNVQPSELVRHDAFGLFRNRLFRAIQILKTDHCASSVASSVVREDARDLGLPDASADLIVTSPPYLGMIDYTTANRLTYQWMGWPLRDDMEMEIGARRYRKRPNAYTVYLDAMVQARNEMARILRTGGYCALVIGASQVFPDAAANVIKMMSEVLDLVWGPVSRTPTRRRVSARGGAIPTEFICVFRK